MDMPEGAEKEIRELVGEENIEVFKEFYRRGIIHIGRSPAGSWTYSMHPEASAIILDQQGLATEPYDMERLACPVCDTDDDNHGEGCPWG